MMNFKLFCIVIQEDDDNRWSLQEEMAHVFNTSLKRTLGDNTDAVSCISACTKDDTGDYLWYIC